MGEIDAFESDCDVQHAVDVAVVPVQVAEIHADAFQLRLVEYVDYRMVVDNGVDGHRNFLGL